ncbi:hypothetical protein J2X28_001217 [Kocuria rhizophila]|nr:hypothetical protein [Kocuria rhizophila]
MDIFTSIIQSLGTVASIVLEFLKAFGIAG